MKQKYEQLKKWIDESNNIVFLGGAGVSTESGIPDFRGENGLYKKTANIPLEIILSHDFFMQFPEIFYQHFWTEGFQEKTEPNQAHLRLAELEDEGKLSAVITQNVDGLHQKAGSKNVLELHGNSERFYCLNCNKEYSREEVRSCGDLPRCSCGGLIRPDVVFYGESLDPYILNASIKAIKEADMLIVGGTSLVVYPAAGLVDYYNGDKLVLINEQATPFDSQADLIITDKIGKVFSEV